MLTTIAIVLVALWLLGFVGFHVLGSFIHILLVIAIILFLVRLIQGRNPIAS
ncbi:MAG TPA: lmo0937 family membrane protein [Candidatus Paceibacterota bacterium]|nr:lmo0937 family membrane protein [Candidatus Paceibacterota bacterium]